MTLSLSSFFSSSLSISVLIGVLYLILKKDKLLSNLGFQCVFLLVVLIFTRAFIPLEFSITKSFYFLNLSYLRDFLVVPRITLGNIEISIFSMLYFIWFSVFGVKLLLLIKKYRNSIRIMNTFPKITDSSILEVLHKVIDDIYPKQKPVFSLVTSNAFDSPATLGFCRPTIMLPDYPYTKEELYYVFYHEIMHYKHHDLIKNICVNIIVAFHWWNPIITKLLRKCVDEIQELLIDSYTIEHLTDKEKSIYMESLTKTMRCKHKCKSASFPLMALVDSHHKEPIQRRLAYIMNHPVKKYAVKGMVLFVVLFIFSFTFVIEPTYVPEKDEVGDTVWRESEGDTYYIKNGDSYDLYMQNEYVMTMDEILDEFKDIPIYEKGE